MLRAAALAWMIATGAHAGDFRAVDGDTLAYGHERIRVMGVDAPETFQAKCPAELDAGLRAKAFTAAALDRGPVTLERHGRDRYGRTLAVVRIDGRDLAVLLIGAGLGRPYHGERRRPWC